MNIHYIFLLLILSTSLSGSYTPVLTQPESVAVQKVIDHLRGQWNMKRAEQTDYGRVLVAALNPMHENLGNRKHLIYYVVGKNPKLINNCLINNCLEEYSPLWWAACQNAGPECFTALLECKPDPKDKKNIDAVCRVLGREDTKNSVAIKKAVGCYGFDLCEHPIHIRDTQVIREPCKSRETEQKE